MKRLGRNNELFNQLISDENLRQAIHEVNRTHHWRCNHRPNKTTLWVELTVDERVAELRTIIINGFTQHEPHVSIQWDPSARKARTICEPLQWPDQYVHHALIQVLMPVLMRGMDHYCCGSIRRRGAHYEARAIRRWMRDVPNTRYGLTCDVKKFYDSLQPELVFGRMRCLIKDRNVLDLIWRIIKDGIKIGYYTSQWFANVYLQPLDALIRQSGCAKYYARYMDNLTILGPDKTKLHELRRRIAAWLEAHGLALKEDWQVYLIGPKSPEPTTVTLEEGILQSAAATSSSSTSTPFKPRPLAAPRRGVSRPKYRLPDAVGYRYGRGYTLPRKFNWLRLKQAIGRYRKRRAANFALGRRPNAVDTRQARGILSRLGQLQHCSNTNLYRYLFQGEKIGTELKLLVRRREAGRRRRKEDLQWNMFLEQAKQTVTRL